MNRVQADGVNLRKQPAGCSSPARADGDRTLNVTEKEGKGAGLPITEERNPTSPLP